MEAFSTTDTHAAAAGGRPDDSSRSSAVDASLRGDARQQQQGVSGSWLREVWRLHRSHRPRLVSKHANVWRAVSYQCTALRVSTQFCTHRHTSTSSDLHQLHTLPTQGAACVLAVGAQSAARV
jgi:hypothetical protein